jgi:hypothetical protein
MLLILCAIVCGVGRIASGLFVRLLVIVEDYSLSGVKSWLSLGSALWEKGLLACVWSGELIRMFVMWLMSTRVVIYMVNVDYGRGCWLENNSLVEVCGG